MRPLHVLLLTPVYPHPGSPSEGLFNEQHARALAKAGVRVTVVLAKPWLPDTLARRWSRYGSLASLARHERRDSIDVFTVRYLHIPRYALPAWTVAACARSIRRLLRYGTGASQGPESATVDLIHAHSGWPVGMAAPAVAEALGRSFLVTFHIADAPALVRTPLYGHMLRRAAARVVVGRPLAEALRKRRADLDVERIPNGIDLDDIRRTVALLPTEERPWGRLVSVANLWPVKGIDLNLRALARLAASGRAWQRYTVVGDGPERPRLEALARRLGIADRVIFVGSLGHREALRQIAAADIFSLPSWGEAFGVVYLEAMACSKPIIGCRTQGAEDIVRHEVDGLLVEPRDAGSLAEALDRLLDDELFSRTLGTAAAQRAAEFTWERNASRYLDLYDRMTNV